MRPYCAPTRDARRPSPGTEPPTFSVIIPAYQAAGYIGDAVASVLGQTRPPLEIVVCDDGSTDELDAALAPYRDRITLLRKSNGGEASAKNAAARASSAEFVSILDADDIYLPERLEALSELSSARPDLDILTTDCLVVVDGQVVRRCYHAGYRFETQDQRAAILRRNFMGPGHMAVRRAALLSIGGFDESIRWATDWDCWIRMILAGASAGMVDEPLAEYRIRRSGLASDRTRLIAGSIMVLEKASLREDLNGAERSLVGETLVSLRQRMAVASTRAALVERRPEGRQLAARLMMDSTLPLGIRLRAALAAGMPKLAARRLEGERELAGGIRVAREP